MAKKEETAAEGGIKPEDAMFMAECLRNLQTPANVDVKGVAAALNYKNSASVANRIRALKKKFDLQLGCTGHAGGDTPGASTVSPRKGAAANRGPIKATAASDEASETEEKATKSGSGAAVKKTRPSRKRATKSAAKTKDSTDEEEVEDKAEEED